MFEMRDKRQKGELWREKETKRVARKREREDRGEIKKEMKE